MKSFTLQQVRDSVPPNFTTEDFKKQPVYTVIKNKVYNIGEGFLDFHPGGSVANSLAGNDATGAFEGFHSPEAYLQLKDYYVGDLDPADIEEPTPWMQDIQSLRLEAKALKLFESSKLYYIRKIAEVFCLLFASIAVNAYYPNTFISLLAASTLLALSWQQAGWLAHDFLHHQVFSNRRINNAVGYVLGNLVQGFSVAWWKQKHCTHHAAPNVHLQDPDIDTMPLLAWSEHALEMFSDIPTDKMAEFMVSYQFILYFPLLSFARFSWALNSIIWNFRGQKPREFPTLNAIECTFLSLHYLWYFGSAFYFLNPYYAIAWILSSQFICGLFLSTVFSLNHNGRPVYSFEDAQKMDFYELAIVTGRNVEPSLFNNWFTGGLNFQIEHHMFPTVPRHKLPIIQPMVEKLAKKHQIPYHTTSFGAGMKEVISRLFDISQKASKKWKSE